MTKISDNINSYQNLAAYNAANKDYPNISYLIDEDEVVYVKKTDYSKQYLTIISLSNNNTITWAATDSTVLKTIQISTDGGTTWTSKTSSTRGGTSLAVLNEGNKLLIKGVNTNYGTTAIIRSSFKTNGSFDICGNIMSLVYGDNFIGKTNIVQSAFCGLFSRCSFLHNAENLILPATTLADNCYASMFSYCSGLTTAPELPATTLVNNCYNEMFRGCTSLVTVPSVLPATTLATYCYDSMFRGCTSLTTAPILPATTLACECYGSMFIGCTSLTTAPVLPATTLAEYCYYSMFSGCTSLTTAPELPATTLVNNCYNSMFRNCSRLNYIKAMFTTSPSTEYTNYWVSGVAATGTFVKNSAAQWDVTGVDGIPTGWTVQTANS